MRARFLVRTFTLAVLACAALTATAHAAVLAVRADLNQDGVADTALVHRSRTHAHIELLLSGAAHPIYLLAPASVHLLRSVDLTGDGRSDLIAASSSGLQVWVNVDGRFVPVPIGQVFSPGATPITGTLPAPELPSPASAATTAGIARPAPLTLPEPDRPTAYRAPPSAGVVLDGVRLPSVSRAPPPLA